MKRVLLPVSAALLATLVLRSPAPAAGAEPPPPLVSARPRVMNLANKGPVVGLAFSPDGKAVATGGRDGGIRIWDHRTGRILREIQGHQGLVHALCFSEDGRRLASGSHDGTARLWDAATGEEVMSVSVNTLVHSVALAPDGKSLALGTEGGHTVFYEIPGGKGFFETQTHSSRVPSICFSPDGRWFVTGSQDGTAIVTHLQPSQTRVLEDFGQRVHAVCFSPDGRFLATGGWDNQNVCLWEVGTWRMVRQFPGHQSGVVTLDFSPDGRILASGSHDGTVRLWDVALGTGALTLDLSCGKVHAIRISPDGSTLAAGLDIGTVLLWDLVRGTPEGDEGASTLLPETARALWERLGDADPAVAYGALRDFMRSRGSALAFLKTVAAPAAPENLDRAAVLITRLDDDRCEAREEASRVLAGMGRAVEPALRKALAETASLEVKTRIEILLEALAEEQMPEPVLRRLRAVQLLAWIGTPEARELLAVLGRGVDTDPGTQEARAALGRMAVSP